MFCIHKYGEIKSGYQYCQKCGKAIAAPRPACKHEWVTTETITVHDCHTDKEKSIIFVLRCAICGEIKSTRIDS